MSKLTAIMFPLAFAVSAASYAQDAAPIRLSLDDAIARGLSASHRVAEGTARQDAADAAAGARHAATMPQVTALAGYTRTNHVQEFTIPLSPLQSGVLYPDAPDNYRARLDAQWPLYTGGRLDALADAAQKDAAASAADVDALRTDLRFEITRAYWALFLADESLRVFDESLERARRQAVDAQNQLDAGLVPPSDVLSARAQESRQQMLRIQAGTTRISAEAELARLVGLQPGAAIQPDGSAAQDQAAAPYSALLARALEQRQDRRALVVRLAGAESREKAAAAGRTPTVALAGGIDYANPNPKIFPRQERWRNTWDASVNVSWALFDGGKTKADAAEAAASKRAIQARIDELDSMVALDIRRRLAERDASRAAIDAAQAGFTAATEAYRVLGDRFRAGVATITDLLTAQVAVTQASLDRTQATVNSYIVDAGLRRALGE